MNTSLTAAAIEYAARGWRVHPLRPRTKLPMLKSWQTKATTNLRTIRAWWRDTPNANVGIATGPESSLFVGDVDGDPLKVLRDHTMPDTAIQLTGGGGAQFFVQWTSALDGLATTRTALLPSFDTRGAGGYVVVPPSVHPSGQRYAWLDGCGPDVRLAVPPAWLVDLLRARPSGARTSDAEWRRIAGEGATEGERNTTLARLAGHLFSHACNVDPVVARELLLAWSQARCSPPMREAEALRTINAIAAKEVRKCAS